MKKSQGNAETNGVTSETHAQPASIPSVIPSIERPAAAAATTPVAAKSKTKAKPGPKPTPKPIPTAAQIEHNKSRGIGQAEALALLADHFASTPVRKSSTPMRKSSASKRKSPSKDSDEQGMSTEAAKSDEHDVDISPVKKKKSKISHESSAQEEVTSKLSAKDKRKSDISMKDANPVLTPEVKKSRTKKLSFADKFHPYKRTLSSKTTGTPTDDKLEQPKSSVADEPQPPVQESEDVREDISAEVDEAMRQHQKRLDREKKANEFGVNPAEKHSRESFGMAGPSVDTKQESGTSSTKRRKTHKSKHEASKSNSKDEKAKFRGLVGLLERKRKSASPDTADLALAKSATETKAKREKKEKKAAKKAREHGWKSGDRDGEGDVVMSN
jgi:hypothetical protein